MENSLNDYYIEHKGLQVIGRGGFAREVITYCFGSVSPANLIVGEYDEVDKYFKRHVPTIIAVGDPKVRHFLANKYPDFDYTILNWGKSYLRGTQAPGAIICPSVIRTVDTYVGHHSIINLNCTIGHESKIGDFTTVSPGVNISGNVSIGSLCYIGTNAVIREGITICDNVIIGAGGVVVKNITEPGTYVGNPVRKLEKNLESRN